MKQLFKLSFITLAIAASVVACKGNKSASGSDSAKTDSSKTDSSGSGSHASDTAAKRDTAKKTDTIINADDTSKAKADTVSRTIKETKTVKRVVKKTAKQ